MELRQLVYFDAVAREMGFTRAAVQLHVAQPAISAQIRRLESELGVALLNRTTRQVSLTQAGELFWARTRGVLAQLETARAELEDLSAVLRGRVRIGATQVLGALDLPGVLADFRRSHPGVIITLRSGLVADLLDELNRRELDVVLGPARRDKAGRYTVRSITEERFVLITAPGHQPAGSASSGLALARDESFICLSPDSGLHAILTEAAAAEGFVPRIEFETYGPASIRELVSAGLGVALLARSAASALGPPVDVHELRPEPAHPRIAMMTPKATLDPATRAFRKHVLSSAGAAAALPG